MQVGNTHVIGMQHYLGLFCELLSVGTYNSLVLTLDISKQKIWSLPMNTGKI